MKLSGKFKVWKAARLKDVEDRKRLRNMRLFQILMKDKASGMEDIVWQNAEKLAAAMCMNYLDSKRIVHCRFCPITDPLRRHLGDMLCTAHHEALVPQKDKTAELAPVL